MGNWQVVENQQMKDCIHLNYLLENHLSTMHSVVVVFISSFVLISNVSKLETYLL